MFVYNIKESFPTQLQKLKKENIKPQSYSQPRQKKKSVWLLRSGLSLEIKLLLSWFSCFAGTLLNIGDV